MQVGIHFSQKSFSPITSYIQFEYTSLTDGFAEIFINKEQGKKKKIRLSGDVFSQEPWKEHLIGCMIDFDVSDNPIKSGVFGSSQLLGYNGDEDLVFTIDKLVGDWVRIRCANICDVPCSSGDKYNGWIRWKDKTRLLIRLVYAC